MIGIGIVTRNRAQILADTLERVRQFTRLPHVLVVADDGSTDTSVDLLRHHDIPYVTGYQRGAAWNRNRAIAYLFEKSRCESLILIDDDCQPICEGWESPWFSASVQYGICFFGYSLPYGNPWPRIGQPCGSGCMSYSRYAWKQIGYMDSQFKSKGYEDADLARRASRAFRYDTADGVPILHYGIRHLAAPAPCPREVLEANRQLYESDYDPSPWRPPWRDSEGERAMRGELSWSR